MERLGRPDAAAIASESIFPNADEPGLVEAWMAERALLAGDVDAAREIAARLAAFGRGSTVEEPFYEIPVLVDALGVLGRWDDLDAALAGIRSRPVNVVWLDAAIDRAQGMRRAEAGDVDGARAAMGRALERYRRLGMPHEIATTLERMGAVEPDAEASEACRQEAAAIRAAMIGIAS